MVSKKSRSGKSSVVKKRSLSLKEEKLHFSDKGISDGTLNIEEVLNNVKSFNDQYNLLEKDIKELKDKIVSISSYLEAEEVPSANTIGVYRKLSEEISKQIIPKLPKSLEIVATLEKSPEYKTWFNNLSKEEKKIYKNNVELYINRIIGLNDLMNNVIVGIEERLGESVKDGTG